jgi:hypothetical protein
VRGVSKENALEAVRGYLCANDVSARDLQFADGQWTRGKSPDTFCPIGPMTPRDEIPDPHALRIRAIVSGEVLQDSTTANLIFGIDEIIAYASETVTLEPGDLIATEPGRVEPSGSRRCSCRTATRSRSRSTGWRADEPADAGTRGRARPALLREAGNSRSRQILRGASAI